MKGEKLINIKKELTTYSDKQLTELLLRLARYKKENKELISFMLYYGDDPMRYAETIKSELADEFRTLQKHHYYSTKSLRKILRTVNRHIKYTASKHVETDLLIWFCQNYLLYADLKTSHSPLRTILTRQIEKIGKLIPRLHEDLRFDYQRELEDLLEDAEQKIRWFRKKELNL